MQATEVIIVHMGIGTQEPGVTTAVFDEAVQAEAFANAIDKLGGNRARVLQMRTIQREA